MSFIKVDQTTYKTVEEKTETIEAFGTLDDLINRRQSKINQILVLKEEIASLDATIAEVKALGIITSSERQVLANKEILDSQVPE